MIGDEDDDQRRLQDPVLLITGLCQQLSLSFIPHLDDAVQQLIACARRFHRRRIQLFLDFFIDRAILKHAHALSVFQRFPYFHLFFSPYLS